MSDFEIFDGIYPKKHRNVPPCKYRLACGYCEKLDKHCSMIETIEIPTVPNTTALEGNIRIELC